jgi:aconitate hydratase
MPCETSRAEKRNVFRKIIESHLVSGNPDPGAEISIKIDQTLTQDATGTMAYLQFEALGVPRVKTALSVSYVDHNTLGTGPENADDHLYLQTAAARYGVMFSRPGNGICHRVHLERFASPGMTLLGSDSHTPTAGAACMVAIGAGGLDIAAAMAGYPYSLVMPAVVNVRVHGTLPPMVSAKDIILEILRLLPVSGGVGKVLEYTGDGVKHLSISERATITNMGAELGLTTSIFPSDSVTLEFLKSQGRPSDWMEIMPDDGAGYDSAFDVDLSALKPMVALPHSPDNVASVEKAGPVPIQQVIIGSCTNSSYEDLKAAALILKGRTISPRVSLSIVPGSRQVLHMISQDGTLSDLIGAGARILECACGPCIGMGQSPATGANSLRTFNRNFEGRSGTKTAGVYLSGPLVAAATALNGELTDPRTLLQSKPGTIPVHISGIEVEASTEANTEGRMQDNVTKTIATDGHDQFSPDVFLDDSMLIFPPPKEEAMRVEVIKGPNIKPVPVGQPVGNEIYGEVLLKAGDNITTDHIMPAGSKILPLRSNIPALAEYCFSNYDPEFSRRAREQKNNKAGFIVAGTNYGQGSSREHAALVPLYLGVKAVFALSFARIHRANLINAGIMPLIIDCKAYEQLDLGDCLLIGDARVLVENALKEPGDSLRRLAIPVFKIGQQKTSPQTELSCSPDKSFKNACEDEFDSAGESLAFEARQLYRKDCSCAFEAVLEASVRELGIIKDGGLLRNICQVS